MKNKRLKKEINLWQINGSNWGRGEFAYIVSFAQNSLLSHIIPCIHLQSYHLLWPGFWLSLSLPLLCPHRDSVLIDFNPLTTCVQKDYLGISEQQNLSSLQGRNKPPHFYPPLYSTFAL